MTKLRKSLTYVSWAASALAVLLTSPVAQAAPSPNDPVVLLLKGLWRPVVGSPRINLSGINLGDGTWGVNDIHAVTGVPNINNQDNTVIGHVYFQGTGCGCLIAYDLPGGAMLMQFTAGAWDPSPIADGHGGLFYQETWDLTVLQATGIYAPYLGGHNHMVDRYDSLAGGTPGNPANGPAFESCYCIISVGGGLPLWWTMLEN